MSRRRREGLSPSLFPFLAVLVCTLGTLILFLALVAQNATEAAEQNSRAERIAQAKLQAAEAQRVTPALTAASAESMIQEEQFRVAQLVAFRESQTADVEDRRDRLTHFEDQMQQLREKLKRLSDEVDNAMGEGVVDKIDPDEIVELRARVNAEQAAVEKLRGESMNKTPRVVIVPHKGPNGTDRRAVYLECTDQGITIWPEGSQIATTQLEATRGANPLDAALRVIRLHVMKHYGDTAPPYPLLVVRPEGIESYAAARKAMQDWDDQFGYELVPSHVKLAFSKPDANLKQRVDLAIRDAAAKQHGRHGIARDSRGGRRRNRFPTLSAASLDRAGRAGGFPSLGDDYAISSPRPGQSPYTGQSPYSGNAPYTTSTQDDRFGGGTGHLSTLDSANAAASTRRMNDAMRAAAREMRDSQRQIAASAGIGNGLPKSDSPQQSNPYAAAPSTGEPNEGESLNEISDASSLSSSGPLEGSETATGESQQQPRSQPPQQLESGRADGSGGSSNLRAKDTSRNSPSSSAMTPQMGQNSSSLKDDPTSAVPPQVNINGSPATQGVRRQGRDWALPPQMAGRGGNAIVRTIRVQCFEDRFVLLPPSAGGATEVFGLAGGNIDRATMQLATAVRDRIERWGAALPGGRWQPRLEIEVMPHGETTFHQLRTLMSGSGLEVTGRASQ